MAGRRHRTGSYGFKVLGIGFDYDGLRGITAKGEERRSRVERLVLEDCEEPGRFADVDMLS